MAAQLVVVATPGGAYAQNKDTSADETVVINCPEQVELRVIVDYVGKALGVRFIYSEELAQQRVELRPSPVELPKKHLLNLLTSLLRVRDLVMVEESPGFYRIVRADQSARSVGTLLPVDSTPQPDSVRMVTQVLAVPSGNVKGVSEKLKVFLSSAKGGLVPVPERGLVIVTDYEARIALLRELVALLDTGAKQVEVQRIEVGGADPEGLAAQVSAIVAESHRLRRGAGMPPTVRGDILPGALVVIGSPDQITQAEALIQRLAPDRAELSTRTFAPRYLSLDRAQRLIEHVVLAPGSGLSPPASVFADAHGGRLFVTAESATLHAIAVLLEAEDRALPETQRPLRIYRPKNRSAAELLGTLSQLLGEGVGTVTIDQSAGAAGMGDALAGTFGRSPPTPRAGVAQVPPEPPEQEPYPQDPEAQRMSMRVQGPDYVLTEDAHTNSILAIGTREFHAQLESLIDKLDRRRPQVLIEMTLVAITLSDSLELGVELETLDLGHAWDYLFFSNFGLSSIDAVTGQRTLAPGLGASGIILHPDEVPILMRTLATRGAARVISTPKLLVSDNARATLRNVDEAPFTSVNASDTVATTSFAGFESAGTTLSVTPHILEGDVVTLEYELNFSNFTGSASGVGVPPPRTTNSFTSTIEVPDGHVVVTGGLVVDSDSDSVSEVPLLGQIPVVGWLFQSSSRQHAKTKIFAFIRPTILRDDQFEALKFITLENLEKAELKSDDPPPGGPLWMH